MSGDGVVAHNRRTYFAENVDPTRTRLNVEYCYTPIEEAYHQLFDAALSEFNAKQKRKDRCIENYYEKIRDGKQEKPFYEVIFQVGNKDDMGTVGENAFWTSSTAVFLNAILIFVYILPTCTWTKPHPICTLTLFPLLPGANGDYPPVYR